jgi:hypothetical protein
MPRPGRFTPGEETRYPLYRSLGGPQGRSGHVRKISSPRGFDPWTVQPVASSYTDYAIQTHHLKWGTSRQSQLNAEQIQLSGAWEVPGQNNGRGSDNHD